MAVSSVVFCTTYFLATLLLVGKTALNLCLNHLFSYSPIFLPIDLYVGPTSYKMGYPGETSYNFLKFERAFDSVQRI
jgi:hypothetical protein